MILFSIVVTAVCCLFLLFCAYVSYQRWFTSSLHWSFFSSSSPTMVTLYPTPCGTTNSPSTLRSVLLVSRHGVRTPSTKFDRAVGRKNTPWPSTMTPAMDLTQHGFELAQGMGRYFRDYYSQNGQTKLVFNDKYSVADTKERTIQTAKALFEGLGFSSFTIKTNGTVFHPLQTLGAQGCKLAPDDAKQAVLDYAGQPLARLVDMPRLKQDLHALDLVDVKDPAIKIKFDANTPVLQEVTPYGKLKGPSIDLIELFSETLLLEKFQGFEDKQLAWGSNPTARQWKQLSDLHSLFRELSNRPPYLAKREGSSLASHVLAFLDEAAAAAATAATSSPTSQTDMSVVVGHDIDMGALAALFGMAWTIGAYGPNQIPPVCTFAFEIHRDGKKTWLEIYVITQSMQQMSLLNSADTPAGRPSRAAPAMNLKSSRMIQTLQESYEMAASMPSTSPKYDIDHVVNIVNTRLNGLCIAGGRREWRVENG